MSGTAIRLMKIVDDLAKIETNSMSSQERIDHKNKFFSRFKKDSRGLHGALFGKSSKMYTWSIEKDDYCADDYIGEYKAFPLNRLEPDPSISEMLNRALVMFMPCELTVFLYAQYHHHFKEGLQQEASLNLSLSFHGDVLASRVMFLLDAALINSFLSEDIDGRSIEISSNNVRAKFDRRKLVNPRNFMRVYKEYADIVLTEASNTEDGDEVLDEINIRVSYLPGADVEDIKVMMSIFGGLYSQMA